jgi:hypothetical protein
VRQRTALSAQEGQFGLLEPVIVSERQCVVDQVKVPACMFEWVLVFSHDASRACSRILTAGLELEETRLLRSTVPCDSLGEHLTNVTPSSRRDGLFQAGLVWQCVRLKQWCRNRSDRRRRLIDGQDELTAGLRTRDCHERDGISRPRSRRWLPITAALPRKRSDAVNLQSLGPPLLSILLIAPDPLSQLLHR